MTVAELRVMLAKQPDEARVLIFDMPVGGVTHTLPVNALLSMEHGGPIVILTHEADQ